MGFPIGPQEITFKEDLKEGKNCIKNNQLFENSKSNKKFVNKRIIRLRIHFEM